MKLIQYITLAAASVSAVLIQSCSDSSDWEPGPKDNDTGVCAYFEPQSSNKYIFGSDADAETMSINVPVHRVNTESAVSLPVTLSSEVSGFTAPSTVEFAAGQAETTIAVNCGGIPKGSFQNVTVSLPEDQTDVYGIGGSSITLSAIISDWKVLADNVTYYYNDSNGDEMYPRTKGTLYHLEGTYMFRLTDFFGSGLEMPFETKTPGNTQFVPTQNADYLIQYEPDDAYNCWYLYNEEEQTWPTWVPGGDPDGREIEYALFYGSADYCTINMIYNSKTMYGFASYTIDVQYPDGSSSWGFWQVDFNLLYNPFE